MPTMTDTLKAKSSCSGFTIGAERFSFTKKVMNFVSNRDTPTPNTPPKMESTRTPGDVPGGVTGRAGVEAAPAVRFL